MKERNSMAKGRKFLFWLFALMVSMKAVVALFAFFVRHEHQTAAILLVTALLPAFLWGCMCRWYTDNGWWT
jgi:uncharacterized membrane protein YraQ (UPF0718 family)